MADAEKKNCTIEINVDTEVLEYVRRVANLSGISVERCICEILKMCAEMSGKPSDYEKN